MEITFEIKPPAEFSSLQIEDFLKLLILQNKAGNPSIEKIKKSTFLCMVYADKRAVGIGAIKQVYNTPFDKANVPDLKSNFTYELGYIFVLDEENLRGQGIGKKICTSLLEKLGNKNVFATTDMDEKNKMKFILEEKLSFKKAGDSYPSREKGKKVGLFLREYTNN
jgi:hypothetical protein